MNNALKDYHKVKKYQQYTLKGQIKYIAEIEHLGLKTHRFLVDSADWMLDGKMKDQFDKWDEIWAKSWQKSQIQLQKEININAAEERTKDCQEKIRAIENILKDSISLDHTINWNSLVNKSSFNIPNPKKLLPQELAKVKVPKDSEFNQFPLEPEKSNFIPKLNVFDNIFKGIKQEKLRKADLFYNEIVSNWENKIEEIDKLNSKIQDDYNKEYIQYENEKKNIQDENAKLEQAWELEMDEFYLKQNADNQKVETFRDLYFSKNSIAIVEYCETVLNTSEYPDNFPREFDLEYNHENKFLIIDYVLPAPDDLPRLMETKYIAAKKETKDTYVSENQFVKMYDSAIYNIALKTIFELYQSDEIDMVDTIVFNGWVNSINKANGKMTNSCIVSIQVKKSEFMDIDLTNVDPKICFKNLKGIGSSKLFGIIPIQPIIRVNKNDKRFVTSYDVTQSLDEGYNLAAMGWEDFEHLIREIFEKEFSYNGGEVKVTQASRDGGVDAIAFDPDPIRGGKIVIQAKRYTNTVGVSAIRDLYGTVLNEGATKGILVTTSDYGPDAYDFVKNKPLTLLSGSNLLYLLEKHGHKAKIDLVEAKRLNKE